MASSSRPVWIDVTVATAVGIVQFAAAIGLHLWFDDLPYDERPVPMLERVPYVLAGLAGCAWLVACCVVAHRWHATTARAPAIAAVLGQLVLTGAGGIAVLVTDPQFLFGSSLEDSIELPNGHHAHLYRGGLFCSYDVFLANADDLIAFKATSISRESCLEPAKLRVDGDRVVVVDERGQPLVHNGADWGAFFDWRPH